MSTILMEPQFLKIFELFKKNVHLTFDLGSRSNVMAPNESQYMVSYMSTIQMESLSVIVSEIFETKTCLTFDLGSRSNAMAPSESPYISHSFQDI